MRLLDLQLLIRVVTAHELRLWVTVIHMLAFRPRRHHPSFSVMIGHVILLSELITTHAPLLFSLCMPLTLLLARPRGLVDQIPWLLHPKLHKRSPALPLRGKP